MLRSWKLGTAFGIGIYVHWSFFLLLVYIAMMTRHLGSGVPLFAVVGFLGGFVCIVLHELGHALMARRFGIPTRDITLYPIGGVARLERMSDRPWEEFWIAVAGPAVNVAIIGVLLVFFVATGTQLDDQRVQAVLQLHPRLFDYALVPQLLIFVLFMNIMLVCFNMIPAFPLDGGRVLRALLTPLLGHLRATEIAAALGTLLAGGFALFGLSQGQPVPVLVALFAVLAGQQELAVVRSKAAHGRVMPALEPKPAADPLAIDPSAVPAEPNFSGFTWDRRARAWIEWRQGRPVQACFVE